MERYIVPMIFLDLDTAKTDFRIVLDALRTAGLNAEAANERDLVDRGDDADRPDPGPTTRELQVHGDGAGEVRCRVQAVVDGQYPEGMVLLGDVTPL
ncbi:hypothetical protein KZX45_05900 [Georgenia sp. EYE_87]|uniref:hypothetical protein n=1 Tax=Georgenia sp. EYE_87 TaxID=2853448 RepID=UPI0020055756|nr:hypothetical protein [Georgenia sp. EYE_87]MCK6210073.1 hypothetical protein [Georgenia sp. EYE_87]